MNNYSWPPAIPPPDLPVKDSRYIKAIRKGKASLWLAGGGILMSLGVMQSSNLLGRYTISQPPPYYFMLLFIGLVCDFSGALLGILSRKTTIGKIGMILSCLAFVSIPVLVLAYNAHNDNWPWLTDDDCSCP